MKIWTANHHKHWDIHIVEEKMAGTGLQCQCGRNRTILV